MCRENPTLFVLRVFAASCDLRMRTSSARRSHSARREGQREFFGIHLRDPGSAFSDKNQPRRRSAGGESVCWTNIRPTVCKRSARFLLPCPPVPPPPAGRRAFTFSSSAPVLLYSVRQGLGGADTRCSRIPPVPRSSRIDAAWKFRAIIEFRDILQRKGWPLDRSSSTPIAGGEVTFMAGRRRRWRQAQALRHRRTAFEERAG